MKCFRLKKDKQSGFAAPLLDAKIPPGDPRTAWKRRKDEYRLVSPLNRGKLRVIVVGTGLAGSSVAAALGELGFSVEVVTFHDSPRRAHSVAAQGGINATRGHRVDGESLERFVYDTVKGGDFRAREAEAYRLGEESARVIDHLNALGTPFAREYGGTLSTRSFGGVQVSRTYYSRGQTGQQLQLASSQSLWRQVRRGTVNLRPHTEMLDLVVKEGSARGIITRNLRTGELCYLPAHAVILATGGYGSIYYHSTLALHSNATAAWRAHLRGAVLANPSFVQFHPTTLPVMSPTQAKTVLMSESLRNDGRIWVPKDPGDTRPAQDIPQAERDYYLERKYPAFGNLCPRDIASRAGAEQIRLGFGVGPLKNSVYLDFADAAAHLGADVLKQRYGNLFEMYQSATGEDPYRSPMRIAPGAHFTMGGLWTDFDLMSNVPGLFVGGEAGFAYHGANRLGANSLLSACVDGSFTLPLSVPNYLAGQLDTALLPKTDPAVVAAVQNVESGVLRLLQVGGRTSPQEFHRRLGTILYSSCGVERNAQGLREGLEQVRQLRRDFWQNVSVPGTASGINQTLEKAGRVADFLELAELMIVDALDREESCGAHFRAEFQSGGEAKRDDGSWQSISGWNRQAQKLVEPLSFTATSPTVRSYQ